MIVLDTHVLVWADADDRRLGRKARARIDRLWANGEVGVPAISFWEVGLLHARGRLRLSTSVNEWRKSLVAAGIVELPLDGRIAVLALDFSALHEDPVDRFVVATALRHDADLMTADERLLAWRHRLRRHDARV